MKTLTIAIISIITLIFMSGCVKEPKVEKLPKKVYTQVGMWYLKKNATICTHKDILKDEGEYINVDRTIPSVNYSRFEFIPVNTMVTIIDEITDNAIVFEYEGKKAVLFNKKGYTGLSENGLRQRMFSEIPVDLTKFTDNERRNIKQGEVALKMSKEAIILSRGYPPIHRTSNLDKNVWRYWEGRFNSRNYIFEKNILIRIDE